ncbi:NAD(P)H-hydrate dehydratase [Alteribacillus sp. HJP-4]|uniref:NAD(P)H-hydrate dehydratase n=1 Tax=Alteribacillus sp. HJP-4 TaxID=2775394 RepID=UPI0035CD14EB
MQVVSGEEMKQIDKYAMKELGMQEEMLMENAGRAAALKIMERYDDSWKTAVLIGKGNNGGDGFVIARTLKDKGWDVTVFVMPLKDQDYGAADYHKLFYERCGYSYHPWDEHQLIHGGFELIIDSMLGTGVTGELRSPYLEAAKLLNEGKAEVASVDIPSGVPSGEELVPETAVRADYTVTLHAPKQSAMLFPARSYYGDIDIVDIGMPARASWEIDTKCMLWGEKECRESLPERKENAHKGSNGKGLLAGGSYSMPGAPALAAEACLRTGAGLLTTALPASILPITAGHVPETTFLALPEKNGAISEDIYGATLPLEPFDAAAAGPGAGREAGTKALTKRLIKEADMPLILDADALYHLPELKQDIKNRKYPLILTPHPGEMAKLAEVSAAEVNKHRFSLSRSFAKEMNCYLILKGPHTIITTPEGFQYVNLSGNEALARGGTGDILTGILLGFVLQSSNVQEACCNAVYIHGRLADSLKEQQSSRSAVTSDFIRQLPLVFQSLLASS